jgi:DNA polymerase-3 subunit alpha
MPYAEVDRIAKMITATIGMTIDKAMAEGQQLREVYEREPQIKELIDTAKKLEGMVRNAGVHAAGVVISPVPLDELVPLYKTKNEEIVTAYDMKAVEKMGLLKMDFLGLTTLTIIDDTLKLVSQTRGQKLDLERLPPDDAETYEKVFHTAYTSGVFQFESEGMRDVLRRYKPNTVEDLTALNALYRPGPIQGGMIADFIERKWGRNRVEYQLPELEKILKETLGVIVYQEQVMQIANLLAGYSLGEADLLRRAMGKKDPEEMAKQRDRFVSGALQRGFPKDKVETIFDQMAHFAGYGFNKSHSAAYALLAYHTAYLKTHYSVEFMAALLTSVTGKTDDVVKYIKECREMQIPVEAPDINVSEAGFTPHGNSIRFGLAAVKNLGHNAIQSILEARGKVSRFRSLYQFCEQADLRLLNKRVLESLIKSGALDPLGGRAQLTTALDKAIEQAQKTHRDSQAGQHGLFGVFDDQPSAANDRLPETPDWDESTRLQNEKEVLGFFISGHPLEKYAAKLEDLHALSTADINAMKRSTAKGEELSAAGVLSGLRVLKSRKGELYANGMLEDTEGKIDVLVFPEAFRRLGEKVKLEVPVLVKGGIRVEEGSAPRMAISDILPLDEAQPKLARSLRVRISLTGATVDTIDELHAIFSASQGQAKVMFELESPGEFVAVMEAEGYNVLPDRAFIRKVESLCGRGSVVIVD